MRAATRPLRTLADAADALGADRPAVPLAEDGPREVQRAAQAFNRMQQRIQAHLEERMRILAAVSHDLQTPITRLRLRADLLDDTALQGKLHADLAEMQSLVKAHTVRTRPGRAGATAARGPARAAAEHCVRLRRCGPAGDAAARRPGHLRHATAGAAPAGVQPGGQRDQFAGAAELSLEAQAEAQAHGPWLLRVLDRGPGIPQADLAAVVQPYVRLEDSRNRGTGGTGLGLAIANELAKALGGRLVLGQRAEGPGLEARVELPGRQP